MVPGEIARLGIGIAAAEQDFRLDHAPSPDPRQPQIGGREEQEAEERGEQQTAEMSLRESEKRFRTLLETITQMTWTSLPTGEVNFYNQRWYDYTGLSFGETKDWAWTSVVHPDDLPAMLDAFEQVVQTGEPFIFENRYRRADGEYRWHLNKALSIRDETGVITLWVGTATDVHDQKTENERLEKLVADRTQELRTSNASLERSNFDLMQFASVASHDLKEPLRKIQAFGSILQSTAEPKLNETERNYFGRMISATHRMQNLVEDVLNLSKLSHQAVSRDARSNVPGRGGQQGGCVSQVT